MGTLVYSTVEAHQGPLHNQEGKRHRIRRNKQLKLLRHLKADLPLPEVLHQLPNLGLSMRQDSTYYNKVASRYVTDYL
jgi:hypothetical protein